MKDSSSEKERGLLFTKGRDILIASFISLLFTVMNPTDYSALALLILFDSSSTLNTPEEYRVFNSGVLLKVKRTHRNLLFPFAVAVLLYNAKCLLYFLKTIFGPTSDTDNNIWDSNGVLMGFAGFAILCFSELFFINLIPDG